MTVFETAKPNFLLDAGLGSIIFILVICCATILGWRFVLIPTLVGKTSVVEKSIAAIFVLAISFISVISIYSSIDSMIFWNKNYDAYVNGECEIVEGAVEDFHPMPETLHNRESFTVSGVKFAYGDSESRLYYEKCMKDGGYIKANGTKVKIWYISTGENGTNLIMRMDILDN